MADFEPNEKFIRQLDRNRAELMLQEPHRYTGENVRALLGIEGWQAWQEVLNAQRRFRRVVDAKFPDEP